MDIKTFNEACTGSLAEWLYVIADWFIPENLRNDENAVQRIRVTVVSCLLAPFIGLFLCVLFYLRLGYLNTPLIVITLMIMALPVVPFLYRLTRTYVFPGTLAVMLMLATITYGNYQYGSGFEYAIIWFACIPVFAILSVGRVLGYIAAGLSIVVCYGFFYMEGIGYNFPDPFSGNELGSQIDFYVTAGALVYVSVLAGAYEWINLQMRSKLNAEIDERKQTEAAFFDQKERAQVTLQSIGDGVITTNARGRIEYLNPTAEHLTGWSNADVIGRPINYVLKMLDTENLKEIEDPLDVCLQDNKSGRKSQHILIDKGGQQVPIEHSAAPISDREGRIGGTIIVFHDVTVERELSQQISYQATHDALTGLTNRHEFERCLIEAIEASQSDSSKNYVLCFLDLDQFKIVNDTCGHRAGDELLCQISYLLKDNARESDVVARLGGDEFALILDNCLLDDAIRIADGIRERIEEFRFPWDERTFSVSVSIGIVSLEMADPSKTHILSAADAACYAAKEGGRNRVHVYAENDSVLTMRHDEMQWIGRLKEAFDNDSFLLVKQPIVATSKEGEAGSHYEVLIRLRGEDGSIINAQEFLTAAERFNLMVDIDRWVIKTLVSWFKQNPRRLVDTHTCAVNLSGHSLNDDRFSGYVKQQLGVIDSLAQKICFEITETTAIANLRRAREFIIDLRSMGCRFALDDFGKGMSSLTYLKNLPVDYLKIDGQFVKDMADDAIDRAMVESINHIGHVLGLQTIAEFVESPAIQVMINEIGVDFAQGYAIGRPVLIDE